jgi:uncharacterized glyoxalase superfamily protein PhnB
MSDETQVGNAQVGNATTAAPPTWQAPDVIPSLIYRDAHAAIDFLEAAFEFERHAVYEGDDGSVHHAELRYGSGMIMLGSATRERDEWPVRSPADAGATTGGIYVIVDDPDAHYARAKAAGAEILRELEDQDYGSRDYSARDPEGYVWSFGTYRPTAGG